MASWCETLRPVNLVQNCYLYLVNRFLGEFLEDRVHGEQLEVNIRNGLVELNDVRFDVKALNNLADKQNWPIEVVDASAKSIHLELDYWNVLSKPSSFKLNKLCLTVQPKQQVEPATSMFDSMWSSRSTSKSLAEDFAKQENADGASKQSGSFGGVESVAQAIDSILNKISVTLIDTTIQLEYLPIGGLRGIGLVFHIDSITYLDESFSEPPKEDAADLSKEEAKKAYFEQSYTSKIASVTGITVSTLEFSSKGRTFSRAATAAMSDDEDDEEMYTASSDFRSGSPEPVPNNQERTVIEFAKSVGRNELIVRLKRSEEMDGPKIQLELSLAPISVFLCPRHLHLLLELCAGLNRPDTEDHSNLTAATYAGKPMSSADYERIERDLQQLVMSNAPNWHMDALGEGRGWATGAEDGSLYEEHFVPLGQGSSALYETALCGSSTMGSSCSSSLISSYTATTNRTHKSLNRLDADPTAEISRFQVHADLLSIVILKEDLLTQSSEDNNLLSSGVEQMQQLVSNFFVDAYSILETQSSATVSRAIDKACKLSHLRFLANPINLECDEKTTSTAFSMSGHLEAPNVEFTECICTPNSNKIQRVPLVTFNEIKAGQSESPSLKLNFKHSEKPRRGSRTAPKTELLFSLGKCTIDVDISILDRISALLHAQPICVVPVENNPWAPDVASGHHATSDGDTKTDVKVVVPSVNLRLLFPVPDFRKHVNRSPWWDRNVRNDFLTATLTSVTFHTVIQNNNPVKDYTLKCRNMHVAYHEDANSDAIPIGKAGFEDKPMGSLQDLAGECTLNVKIFPTKKPTLEEVQLPAQEPTASSFYVGFLENQEPSGPFSSKRVVYESDTPHHKNQMELLEPGSKAEIKEFIETTTASAQVRIELALPVVSLQLINKHLYETIYNRINNDLLLWESSAPKLQTAMPAYANLGNLDFDGQPEVFRPCSSGIVHDSDNDSYEDGEDNLFYSAYGSRAQSKLVNESKESYLTLNIKIGRGLLCMCTPVRNATESNVIPNQQGEFQINVEDAQIFVVNGYMGDMDLGFTCLELRNAQLYHCDMLSTPSHSPPLKDIGTVPSSDLHPTIYASESGMLANSKGRGGNRAMVTLCVKIRSNHETHHVKNVAIAAGFNKITLRHRMCNEPNTWISQLIDFFNVKDYAVPGYNAKEIVTELFLHFWDSAIDYRPKYLSLRSAITLGSFSISSHLSAEATNSSTLRLIAEECGLFLSKKSVKRSVAYGGSVDLQGDYVNVVDLGLFEISLKTSDKKSADTPHFDLRASNNIIHIRTCADSAKALTQLIRYLASNGDLAPPEDFTASGSSTYSSPRHMPDEELVAVERQDVANLSASQHQTINDLIRDAVREEDEESNESTSTGATWDPYSTNAGTKLYYFPDERPSVSEQPVRPLPQVTAELGYAPFRPFVPDVDDDFCIIDEEPDYNIFPKDGTPEIRWLSDEPVRIVDNYFNVPNERSDPLKTPKGFPTPIRKYTLCEMSVVWQMYGGDDFGADPKHPKKKGVNFADARLWQSVRFSNTQKEEVVMNRPSGKRMSWLTRGGPNRNHDVLMELQLNKIRFQHEVYPETTQKASRQVLIVSDFEVRDRLLNSQLNKFLYQWYTQTRPKQSNANMLTIKIVHERPNPKLRSQESCLKISLLPLRFNIDQEALLFLNTFFTDLCSDAKDDDFEGASSKHSTPIHQAPVMTVNEENEERAQEAAKKAVNDNLLLLLDEDNDRTQQNQQSEEAPSTSSGETEYCPIYFRRVIFAPDVPIRLDYQGKCLDLKTYGAFLGLIMGLAQLNCSELRLKSISHRHGLLGIEKLLAFMFKEWGNDMRKNQIPSILVGVGPTYFFVQIFQGLKDLLTMPFEQYRKDGRFFRGLHRGANSFTSSTAMACLELTSRLIQLIQVTAETAFDMLTPGPSVRINPKTKVRRKRYGQPKDIREGVTNAYKVVKEGLEETADNFVQVATHEHEQKGYSGAVGGVIRQIPPTIIKPIIIASEATNNVLGGVRCQLVPDARKEAHEKWRTDDYNDAF